jgi:hypothetical protein
MPAGASNDVIARVRRWREVQTIQYTSAETLDRVRKFLQDHETISTNEFTHTVFDCYYDWWADSKSSFKLTIVDDNAIDLLNWCIAVCYDLNVPLTLAEKRTPEIRFIQDLSIWGSDTQKIDMHEFAAPEGCFVKLLGQILGSVYPDHDFLDFVVFDATGASKMKGVMKTSIRIVWSGLVVDKERALRIHDYVVHKFKESVDGGIKDLLARIQTVNDDNKWDTIFSDEVYQGKHGVRMPLNDRVSPSPMKACEHRPFAPVSVIRCTYKEGQFQNAERMAEKADLEGQDWVKIGTIRQVGGTPKTEWTEPVWQGVRPARTHVKDGNLGGLTVASTSAAGAARSAGQVKLRTRGGSDNFERPARVSRGPQANDERVDIEREFDGTMDEFEAKLVEKLGKENWTFEKDDYALTCKKQGDGGAQIVFKAKSKRVYISGKQHQVRSVLTVIQTFARGVGEVARSMTGTVARSHHTNRSGGGYTPSIAPSACYAPVGGSVDGSRTSTSAPRSDVGGASTQSSERVAKREFVGETAGELSLAVGDKITITSDPDENTKNVHRWVYGENHRNKEMGWFPYSHTAFTALDTVEEA